MPITFEKPSYKNSRKFFCVQKTARKNAKYSSNETILKIGHFAKAIAHAKAIAFAKWLVKVKNQKCQKHAKNHSTRTVDLFCAKNGSKKRKIFENIDNFENRPFCKGLSPCKGYSLCKTVSLGLKLNCQKHAKNNSTRTVELFCAKNGTKKYQIFEK